MVLMGKEAEVLLAGTVTDPGIESAGAVLVKARETPDAGAAFDRITMQEVLEFAARFVAAHCREETRTGETSATEMAAEDPFSVAVMVAV